MLGGAYWECRRIEETARAAAADPTLGALYAVDVALLSPAERALLAALAEPAPGAAAAGPAGDDVAAANHLERLGMLRRADRGGFEIASPLFAGWLRTRPPQNA